MDRQGRMNKKNKILGTERCENIDAMNINKKSKILEISSFMKNGF